MTERVHPNATVFGVGLGVLAYGLFAVHDAAIKLLVETLAGDFDADDYEDDYREAVETMVKAKIEGGEVKRAPEAKKTSGEVVDLLAALQRSVDAAKSARGEKATVCAS